MSKEKTVRFNSIEAENLKIVDQNGTVRLSLFNNENIPPLLMNGEDILPGHRQNDPIAGIMFYNSEGDECGGLIYGSEKDEKGNYNAGASLTLDQYKQDQVMQMYYSEENGEREYGFSVYDRADTPLPELNNKTEEIKKSITNEELQKVEIDKVWAGNAQRIFMGKNKQGAVSVRLMDSKGNQRIRMVVDENDVPRMEFLDADGTVIYKLPPE